MAKSTFSNTRLAGLYFALQSLAVLGWWWALREFEEFRKLFLASGTPERDLMAFFLPDLVLVAAGSLLAAILFFAGARWVMPVAWLLAGGLGYATLYCVSLAWMSDSAWWSVALMTPAAFFSTLFAVDLSHPIVPLFRLSRSSQSAWNVFKTFCQIVLFWSFFLGLLPLTIRAVEGRLGLPQLEFPFQVELALALFGTFSLLGAWSGWSIARHGLGTPLPLDTANRLVVSGPYAHIRNPMIVAGLGQGLAVGLGLGSPLVLAYLVAGGLIWQFLVRPSEEADLSRRFGESYQQYRQRVPCWFPSRRQRQR